MKYGSGPDTISLIRPLRYRLLFGCFSALSSSGTSILYVYIDNSTNRLMFYVLFNDELTASMASNIAPREMYAKPIPTVLRSIINLVVWELALRGCM